MSLQPNTFYVEIGPKVGGIAPLSFTVGTVLVPLLSLLLSSLPPLLTPLQYQYTSRIL